MRTARRYHWRRGAMLARPRLVLTLTLTMAASLLGMAASTSSMAATTPGYPTALVEYQASTRTQPYLNNTYWGYALRDPRTQGKQTVSVKCWYDGATATGNYTTNRWFRVLVWENYDGYNTPRWLFVTASYVYNQPVVPMCVDYPTGVA
jgi:hypothetical protein